MISREIGLFKLPKRFLYSHQEALRSKVLFVSNTGLFALHWALNYSPHAKSYDSTNIIVFYKEPWFCKIHPTHFENKWGQSPNELPQHIRDIFYKKIASNHKEDEPVTFKQFKDLHEYIRSKIKSRLGRDKFFDLNDENNNYPVIEKIQSEKDGYRISYDDKSCEVNADTIFYNWLRTPRKHLFKSAAQRYISDIYFLSKDFFMNNPIQNIIVHGASATIPWIIRDFDFSAASKIFMLRRKEDKILAIPRNHLIELNKVIHFIYDDKNNNIVTLDGLKCDFRPAESMGNIMELSYKNEKESAYYVHMGHFYKGIGSTPELSITHAIKNKLDLPAEKDYATNWVAPQNIPVGSLTESFLLWMNRTKNIKHSYEPQIYHDDNEFREIFLNNFLPGGKIREIINGTLFNKINKQIKSIPSTKNNADFHKDFEDHLQRSLKEGLSSTISNYINRK